MSSVDPFRPVLELGRRHARGGMLFGLAGALFLHGGATARAFASMIDMAAFAGVVQSRIEERFRTTYDIELDEPPPPPPPPEPEPAPEPEKPPEVAKPEAPPQAKQADPVEPPPEAAQAGKVLTSEPDPNEPVDLTDQGFVTGDGQRYAGGTTATRGTATNAVHNPAAVAGGAPTGRGTVPAPPSRDLSRAALPVNTNWNCGFPAEADMEQINSAVVRIVVTVSPEGRAKSVQVMQDPGYGFGALARQCALRMRFNPGYDALGKPVTKTTPPFTVRFNR